MPPRAGAPSTAEKGVVAAEGRVDPPGLAHPPPLRRELWPLGEPQTDFHDIALAFAEESNAMALEDVKYILFTLSAHVLGRIIQKVSHGTMTIESEAAESASAQEAPEDVDSLIDQSS